MMSLAVPNAVLLSEMPWKRILVFAAANAQGGDGSTRQIQAKVKLRRQTVLAELEALESMGLHSLSGVPLITRHHGCPTSIRDASARVKAKGRMLALRADLGTLGWTAIPASEYAHLASAEARFEALKTALRRRSGTILSTTSSSNCFSNPPSCRSERLSGSSCILNPSFALDQRIASTKREDFNFSSREPKSALSLVVHEAAQEERAKTASASILSSCVSVERVAA